MAQIPFDEHFRYTEGFSTEGGASAMNIMALNNGSGQTVWVRCDHVDNAFGLKEKRNIPWVLDQFGFKYANKSEKNT
jgi:hypothetical protein